jgi:hypothetical protein
VPTAAGGGLGIPVVLGMKAAASIEAADAAAANQKMFLNASNEGN